MAASHPALPIDELLPAILRSLHRSSNLVLSAAPGAGKTTRVPPALLDLFPGDILVLEPRRLAARLAARRVASERDEPVGGTVGYQVRFEDVTGPRTRLRFVTEGVLTRRLLSNPELRGVDAVVLDEFHERHLDTDLALALLKRLQARRPELRLIVMSATLAADHVAAFLDDCPVFQSQGRTYPLAIEHLAYSQKPLEAQIHDALESLLRGGEAGHILVFLPGAAEIRRAERSCAALARTAGALVLPLFGDLAPAEQDRAVAPSQQQKIILATNVAESSVTVEGVTAVIDSGLARIAAYSPWSGLPTLTIGRISKASAAQRAGRAGRTGPGRALRLYPHEDFAQRPDFDLPEILRGDLSGLCLALRAMGLAHMSELAWLDPPPAAAVEHAERLLDRLGASSADEARELARLPLPPRLSRVLTEALRRDAGEGGIAAAALLGSGLRLERTDVLAALDLPPDPRTEQGSRQLRRIVRPPRQARGDDTALLLALLTGFPDRVARLRTGNTVLLSGGIAAELAGVRPPYEFMVVLDAEERSDGQLPVARITSRIEPEWLLDLFPERLRDDVTLEWNRTAERVEAVSSLRYDDLVMQESRGAPPGGEATAALLAQQALATGLERFVDPAVLAETLARIRFAGLPEPDLAAMVQTLCTGLRSFAELRSAATHLLSMLEAEAGSRLRQLAPPTLRLSNGRQTPIHYEEGKPPWVAARLQDFFGMRESPRVGRDGVPLVLHLLAPNRRAVQTTTDLGGFWERLYPQLRRELMRRYPRHPWPERP